MGSGPLAKAQTGTATSASQTIGAVTAIDNQQQLLTLKDDHGGSVRVSLGSKASLLRVAPGQTDLKNASRISFAEIGVGDRVLAVGTKTSDGSDVQARTLVVMNKSELAEKEKKEQEEWQQRGVSGTVTSVAPQTNTFTIQIRKETRTVQGSDKTEYRRYAPDSIQFSDSAPSTLAEVKPGDQVRVLAAGAPDGATIQAERVVSGSFRQIAGTVVSVDAAAKEIRVTDLASKKPITIRVNATSVLKQLTPAIASALSQRYGTGGSARSQNGAPAGENTPERAGRPRAGSGDLGQVLDRLPAVEISALKPGQALMISGSAGTEASQLTAITLLAGVEPLLTASPTATRDIMAGWNFGEAAPE
jgi:hypothetical protein